MPKQRLIRRLFPSYLLITLVSILALAGFALRALEQSHIEAVRERLEAAARVAEKQLQGRLTAEQAQAICNQIARSTETRLTVVMPDGDVLSDTAQEPARMDNHAARPEIKAALMGETIAVTRYSYTSGRQEMYFASPLWGGSQVLGALRCSVPKAVVDDAMSEMKTKVGGASLVIGLVAAGLSYLAARRFCRPFTELNAAAASVANGDFRGKLSSPDYEEMSGLAESFNRICRQLEERTDAFGRQDHEQEAVLASMAEGVLAVDSEERVISINRAAADLIGAGRAELSGRNLQEVVRNADLRRFATLALVSDEPIEDDLILLGDPGRVLRARGTALRDRDGRSIGAVTVLNDVTHFRHLENVRRDFVANVSHELKTPITSIKGFVETLLDGAMNNPHDAERFLKIVAKQADRLNSIIEDLLSLSKIEQSEEAANLPLEEDLIKPVLETALLEVQSKAAQRQIPIQIACADGLSAPINRPLLEQALMNLLDNAIKYSEPGQKVLITARQSPEEVTIAVIDQGCGVEREHLPRLFERFYRVDKARSRKLGGTGLGLAIVKHIVQAHGGRISVKSAPGKGSTFTIHLSRVPVTGRVEDSAQA